MIESIIRDSQCKRQFSCQMETLLGFMRPMQRLLLLHTSSPGWRWARWREAGPWRQRAVSQQRTIDNAQYVSTYGSVIAWEAIAEGTSTFDADM